MQPKPTTRGDEIAIVGMASLFTGSPDLASFWRSILGKMDGARQAPPDWHPERYLDPTGQSADRLYTTTGGFLGDDYRFDPLEFGIMPGSVDGQEPDQFIALRVARDALADAGYLEREFDRTRTGVILGHSTYLNRAQANAVQFGVVLDQTLELLDGLFPGLEPAAKSRIRDLLKAKLAPFNADTGPGLVPNVMTGRIANRLDLGGPNYIVDAACASSLLAIQSSIEELRDGRSDMMLAGGVNASTPAEAFLVFCQLGALSRRSRIRPFDAEGDGTLLGEGAGVVVLKRHTDAIQDGDRIYALIRGVGQSSDGRGAGLLAPRLEGEILALRRGYQEADLEPQAVTLIEAHGTGIPLGDRTEIEALRTVFGRRPEGAFPQTAIGSVKSQICHCIPAAGVAGVIKTALSLHHRVLPPTLCDKVNPALGLEDTPFYVNTETRPWIHQRSQPRRAAVSAFGFGGVNAHCVLEEAPCPSPGEEPRLSDWPHELVVLAAEDRAGLIKEVQTLAGYIEDLDRQTASLADIAFSLAARTHRGTQRLAIVADSPEDLGAKLSKAETLLADEAKRRIQTRSGIYFTDRPLDGRLAFLFPGEGAQYPGMLADLAIYFPVVRSWFDLWDSIFEGSRSFAPSSVVFPPPTRLEETVEKRAGELIFGLEIGSESVFIASQALHDLLSRFGLHPDAVLGHSSGENTALVVAGAVDLGGPQGLRGHIMRLNRMYQEMEETGGVATGRLLTVGAIDRDRIIGLVDGSDGRLHLALDNCRHQAVLYGSPQDIEAAAETLRREGGLCSTLPFDRAYHTPLFEPVARLVDQFYEQVQFGEPRFPIYSCASCDLFPIDAAGIRRLTVDQWQSRVRFTETVERLHSDGFRYLLEVGPSSNLTGFVDDILRGKDYLAASVDNRNRSGLRQLLHLLGRLLVSGKEPNLAYLFEGRGCRSIDFDAAVPAPKTPPKISNTLPYIRLASEELAEIREMLIGRRETPTSSTAPDEGRRTERRPRAIEHPALDVASSEDMQESRVWVEQPPGTDDDGLIVDYLSTMRDFLQSQQTVMTAAFADTTPSALPRELPLIQRITERTYEHVETETEFDLSQEFVLHHTLYADRVSDQDPDLTALPVVPLTVSLELLAETASVLAEGLPLVALEQVRAYNWVALDSGSKLVRTTADLVAGTEAGTRRARCTLYDGDQPLLSGEVVFSDRPASLPASLPPLIEARPSTWSDEDLYTKGMFHGPLFHSVKSIRAWDDDGLDAALAPTPTNGFFYPGDQPRFLLNPVLLDAVGHLTAFWVAQRQGTDFSSFPSSIERIVFGRGTEEDTEEAILRGRLSFLDESGAKGRFLIGNYECEDPSAQVLFRIQGWRDRFFTVPHRFYLARTSPRETWLGEDCSGMLSGSVADGVLLWSMETFDPVFLNDAGGVWRRLLAHTYLGAEERLEWQALTGPAPRLNDWLMARIALKEAVRLWLWQRTDVLCFPADVVIASEPAGRPFVARHGLEAIIGRPEVSVSHCGDRVAACVAEPGTWVGIDVELVGHARTDDVMETAYTASERRLIQAAVPFRREHLAVALWCAKEAAGKALGIGLGAGPQLFEVSGLSGDWDCATVSHGEWVLPVSMQLEDTRVLALSVMTPGH